MCGHGDLAKERAFLGTAFLVRVVIPHCKHLCICTCGCAGLHARSEFTHACMPGRNALLCVRAHVCLPAFVHVRKALVELVSEADTPYTHTSAHTCELEVGNLDGQLKPGTVISEAMKMSR